MLIGAVYFIIYVCVHTQVCIPNHLRHSHEEVVTEINVSNTCEISSFGYSEDTKVIYTLNNNVWNGTFVMRTRSKCGTLVFIES
jgi:hypothetical protein